MTSNTQNLIVTGLFLVTLIAACGDNEEPAIPSGTVCITVLDQYNKPMEDCDFSEYRPNEDYVPTANLTCGEGSKFIEDLAGEYEIPVKCKAGALIGSVNFEIRDGEHRDLESRLIGSLCSKDTPLVVSPQHPVIDLQDKLGFSTDQRCSNWFERKEIDNTSIEDQLLQCNGMTECNPLDGRDILVPIGEFGDFFDNKPIHLSMEGKFARMTPGEEVTIMVTLLSKMKEPGEDIIFQTLDIPILVRNSP